MSLKKLFLSLTLMMTALVAAYGQKDEVRGVVLDELNEPLAGATVMVKGTTHGVVTDVNGQFKISDAAGKMLVFQFVGYTSQTLKAANGMKVTLQPSAALEEVVVTGFQQIDKRMFTGAAVKVDADKAKLSGLADVSRSLEGRVAGVQVTNVSGTFGAAPKIRVRGATSIYGNSKPLWVVDGVIYEDNVDVSADDLGSGDAKTLISSAVAGLNADDIESFYVLKDGSATSIYGARAMGGVVVVTTKKGKAGHSNVSYTGEFSTRLKPTYNEFNIMNSQEIMGVYKEMENKGWLQLDNMVNAENTGIYGLMFQMLRKYDQTNGQFGLANTEAARNAYLQEAEFRNTDWFDLLFKSNVTQTHSISISNGTERSQSYFSISLMNDPGWYNRSKVNRYTFNGNVSYDILKNLTVRLAAQGMHRDQEAPGSLDRSTDVVSGEVKRDFDINPFSFAMNTSRCLDPNYDYTRFYTKFNIFNELENNYNEIKQDELMFRAELQYKPISSVTIEGLVSTRMTRTRTVQNVMDDSNQANAYRAGTDATDDNSTIRDSNSLLYTDPDNELAIPETILPKGGIKYQTDNEMRSYNYRGQVKFDDVFKELHTVKVWAGAEMSQVKRTETKWTGWGYQFNNGGIVYTPYLWLKQMNEENTDYFHDTFTRTNTVAFFGTATYSFDKRYTLNGTLRYEGTNRLGKTNQARWLPTWNVSGLWSLADEHFMENARSWLNTARVRVSYSLTADTGPSSVTNAHAIYMTENVWRPYTSAAESQIYIYDLANSELTYEKKHEFNLGLDLGFIDNRITLTGDIYWRDNFDLIGATYTQGAGGQIGKWANVADMKTRGWELGLATVNVRSKHFNWSTDFNFSHEYSEITRLDKASRVIDLVVGTGYALEGYPRRSIFSYKFAGLNSEGLPMVYNEAGIATVGDVNFQETENLTDFLVYEGAVDPTFYGSFGNSFQFKGEKWGKVDLEVYITFSGGNVVRLDPVFRSSYSDLSTLPKEFKNRWMQPGDENKTNIPAIASKNQVDRYGSTALSTAYNAYNYSTERIADGDFIRLKEVGLTYTAPQSFLKHLRLSNLSLKVAATNLCLLYADKKLNGQDPEFINAGGVASPIAKQFTATLRLGF